MFLIRNPEVDLMKLHPPLTPDEVVAQTRMFEKLPDSALVAEITVACLMGRTRRAIQDDRHLKRGIPYVKLDRTVRYRVGDVRQHLKTLAATARN